MVFGQVMVEQSSNTSIDINNSEIPTTASLSTPKTEPVVRRSMKAAAPVTKNSTQGDSDIFGPPSDATGGLTKNLRSAEDQIVTFPPKTSPEARKDTFLALQEWEGHVVGIEQNAFIAHLIDLTAEKLHESEEATVPIEELSERDAANLKVGDRLSWMERVRSARRRRSKWRITAQKTHMSNEYGTKYWNPTPSQ